MAMLALAGGPIERVRADVAVVPLFAGERPLRGAAGRVDWRLCGRLSHLFAAGRLSGEFGEAVLIPGGGGMRSPRVLGLGLGERECLDTVIWEDWVADVLARVRSLAARNAVVALPDAGGAIADRLTAVARHAAGWDATAEIAIAPEPGDVSEVADWLRAAARRSRPEGLEIRAPAEVRTPHGAAYASDVSSHAPADRSTR